jgi:hypothetical protein
VTNRNSRVSYASLQVLEFYAKARERRLELTVHDEHDPLADSGRNTIRRDAEIRAHVQSIHPGNVEYWALHARH